MSTSFFVLAKDHEDNMISALEPQEWVLAITYMILEVDSSPEYSE